MTNSNERTEVARKLRALPDDVYAALDEWEREGLIIETNRSDEADYSQIHNALFGCFPPDSMHPCDYEELHNRLADLIDPVCEIEDAGDVPDAVKDNLTTWFCSECGSPIYNDMSPSYCLYCGARVVNADE